MNYSFRLFSVLGALVAVMILLAAAPAAAQNCPCPPTLTPGWHGDGALGFALTTGNTDTQSYSLDFRLVWDPQRKNLVKFDGLYLRQRTDGEDTADKSSLGARDEYRFGRMFVYAETRYQRDQFKELEYLVTPAVGAGYKLVDETRLKVDVDGGVGLVFEELKGRPSATTSGGLRAGESVTWNISPNAKFTHLANAIWKMEDFSDAFYHVDAALSASIIQRVELRLAGLIDVKNKPASPDIETTDMSLLASIAYKF